MIGKLLASLKKLEITKTVYKMVFRMVGMLPADQNLIVFESFLGKQYSCNPRAIYEYLKENNPGYKMYWSIDPRFKGAFAGKDIEYMSTVATDTILELARKRTDFVMSDEDFEAFAKYHLATCEKRELLGASSHLLYICKKK